MKQTYSSLIKPEQRKHVTMQNTQFLCHEAEKSTYLADFYWNKNFSMTIQFTTLSSLRSQELQTLWVEKQYNKFMLVE